MQVVGHSLRGECGLKCLRGVHMHHTIESLSARRVWIEIRNTGILDMI
mgnify:CR=1 FL=1